MDLNQQKEQFSLAYIHAVAACAGYQYDEVRDRASVDGQISSDQGLCPVLQFQAKATSTDVVRDRHVRYDLPVKNQNDLCVLTGVIKLLIVVTVPAEVGDWSTLSADELCLRGRGYWLSLRGQPPSNNPRTRTVHIPRTNTFTPDDLPELMRRVEERDF